MLMERAVVVDMPVADRRDLMRRLAVIEREAAVDQAYREGFDSAVDLVAETSEAAGEELARRDRMIGVLGRQRAERFNLGLGSALLGATVLCGLVSVGLLPLALVQIVLLAGGLVALALAGWRTETDGETAGGMPARRACPDLTAPLRHLETRLAERRRRIEEIARRI
ncbi:MAG: hypothetical protein R3D33_07840 [Hyphomicrobiaceae bacterium]